MASRVCTAIEKIKMKNNQMKIAVLLSLFAIIILSVSLVSAANACCEKTITGAWCQNSQSENCDPGFRQTPTSCEATSYCKKGCCFDSQEGLCMENTPQKVCQDNEGSWSDSADCSISQCSLGCCVLGNEAAFVTKVRCKTLTGFYGLVGADFRSGIKDEMTCLAEAKGEDEGACVYEDSPGHNTCKFVKRSECKETVSTTTSTSNATGNETEVTSTTSGGQKFHKGTLCTAQDLNTDCQKSKITMLVDGKDEIYYVDTCKQKANIYDASRYDDSLYWTYVVEKSQSCGAGQSNAGSKTCGNCDYYLGSIGKLAAWNANPTYGKYICSSLDCEGHKHGESWCVYDSPRDYGQDSVGSRDFKEVCVDNEILQEPCADFRNEICVEEKTGSYNEARCIVNKWQDCLQQAEQDDCEDINARDCYWKERYYYDSNTEKISQATNETDEYGIYLTNQGVCLPRHPPGFTFWDSSSSTTGTTNTNGSFSAPTNGSFGTGYVEPRSDISSSDTCGLASVTITSSWTQTTRPLDPLHIYGGDGDWECKGVTYTDEDGNSYEDSSVCEMFQSDEALNAWANDMNNLCGSLGDCGGKTNWIQAYTDFGFSAYNSSGRRIAGSGGSAFSTKNVSVSQIKSTGNVVLDFINSIYEGK